MSVILATPGDFGAIRKTLSHLAAQTALPRIELVIVASSVATLRPDARLLAAFPRHRIVEVGDFGPLGTANAAGVRAASAPVVVLAEDHCFPDPEWAAHLIRAHQAPWAAIGPAVRNANPATLVSWADLFIGYGPWLEPVDDRDVDFLPGHNSSYKRELLLGFGDRLDALLNVETVLHWELRAKGHRLRLEPAARVAHTNFSLWSSWLPVSLLNGRAFAAERRKRMGLATRVAYVVGAPLIPLVRAARTASSARTLALRRQFLLCLPVMLVGLAADALGQMLGYAIGAGSSGDRLSRYECHRVRHVTARDRREVFAE
ncbi:MAG: glycosyltransferase family 2 protein [Gemmatimonadaceae bacterium]